MVCTHVPPYHGRRNRGGTGGLCPPNFYVSVENNLTANNSKLITTSCAPLLSTTSYAYAYGGVYTCTTLWWYIHMHHLMVVHTHAPPYGGLYTCTTLRWYTHAPPYGGLYTCTTLWWSIHMHHLMVVYTHVPPYGGIHMHHLMVVYTHAPPYGGLYTCTSQYVLPLLLHKNIRK